MKRGVVALILHASFDGERTEFFSQERPLELAARTDVVSWRGFGAGKSGQGIEAELVNGSGLLSRC
jgi:hypothetical protein